MTHIAYGTTIEQLNAFVVQITNSSRVLKIKVKNEHDLTDIICAIYALEDNMEKQNQFKFGSYAPVRLANDVTPYICGQGSG